jgi:integrase
MSIIEPRGDFAGQKIVDATRHYLEPDEVKRLFEIIRGDSFWYPYFWVQFYFGCRVSEPALILKEDVSFDSSQIIIRRLKKKTDSGFSEHVYSLTSSLEDAFRSVLDWNISNDLKNNLFLFPSHNRPKQFEESWGDSPKERMALIRKIGKSQAVSRMTAHRRFKSFCAEAEIPTHLSHSHILRHTRATLMLAADVPPEHVQFLLGHASLHTTFKYLHVAQALKLRYETSAHLSFGLEDIL